MPSLSTTGLSLSSPRPDSTGATADQSVTAPIASPQQGETETKSRLTPDGNAGINTGRSRFQDEDESSLIIRQAIQMEAIRLVRIERQVVAQGAPQSATSSSEMVAQATNRIYVSQQRIDDTTRALQKLQRSCNHSYDRVSRRCLYCTKHRDSHVYDTTKLILNQS